MKKHKEIKVGAIHIPDNYVRVGLLTKKDFINTLEEDSSYFREENTLIALGEGIVFLYEDEQ